MKQSDIEPGRDSSLSGGNLVKNVCLSGINASEISRRSLKEHFAKN